MPAYTISGLSSGQNTNDVVRKLVELESKPIHRWQKESEYHKVQIKAWSELRILTINLQTKTKALTSFTAPFSGKKITPSEEGFFTGEANRSAKQGKQQVEIIKLATTHKIAGNKIKKDTILPEGKFSIISKDKRVDIDFKGGKLDDLNDKIKAFGASIVRSSVTKVDTENQVLSLHALQYGQEAALKLLDPNGILKTAGLTGDNVPEPPPTVTSLPLQIEQMAPYLPDKYKNSANAESAPTKLDSGMQLKPNTAFSFPVNKTKIEKLSYIEFYIEKVGDGNIPEFMGLGATYESKEGEKTKFENLPLRNGKYTLNLSEFKEKELTKVILANNGDTEISITGAKYFIPGEIQGAAASNTITPAQDALFKVDGIEITRDTNEKIKDVIDGVSLTLLKETPAPVTFEVSAETNKGITMIREFVDAYNELIKYTKDITSANKDAKVDLSTRDNASDISAEYWENKTKSGILAGEAMVVRLAAGLKTATSASYPSTAEPRFKVLSDIGITTGEPGSNWKQIQEGLLKIDEISLQNALNDHPESVRELFASDSNEDSKMDDGVGIAILEHIKPYTQMTSGLVTSKIKLSEETVSDNTKKIKEFENHLVNYERKLKQKYLYMEQGVGKNKAVGNYLKNNLQGGRKDD